MLIIFEAWPVRPASGCESIGYHRHRLSPDRITVAGAAALCLAEVTGRRRVGVAMFVGKGDELVMTGHPLDGLFGADRTVG